MVLSEAVTHLLAGNKNVVIRRTSIPDKLYYLTGNDTLCYVPVGSVPILTLEDMTATDWVVGVPKTQIQKLVSEFAEFLQHYDQLRASGDCGNWDAEDDEEYMRAKKAIEDFEERSL